MFRFAYKWLWVKTLFQLLLLVIISHKFDGWYWSIAKWLFFLHCFIGKGPFVSNPYSWTFNQSLGIRIVSVWWFVSRPDIANASPHRIAPLQQRLAKWFISTDGYADGFFYQVIWLTDLPLLQQIWLYWWLYDYHWYTGLYDYWWLCWWLSQWLMVSQLMC